jgi:hypothetical protein
MNMGAIRFWRRIFGFIQAKPSAAVCCRTEDLIGGTAIVMDIYGDTPPVRSPRRMFRSILRGRCHLEVKSGLCLDAIQQGINSRAGGPGFRALFSHLVAFYGSQILMIPLPQINALAHDHLH